MDNRMMDEVLEARRLSGYTLLRFVSGQILKVPSPLFKVLRLHVGDQVDVEAYRIKLAALAPEAAMERAAWLLKQRDYSSHVLGQKLSQVGYTEGVVQHVLAALQSHRYLDDERYARQLLQRKKAGAGRRGLAQQLRQKGIPSSVAQQLLEEEHSPENELKTAILLLKKHLRGKNWTPEEIRRKGAAMFARRGFGWDSVRAALDQVLDDDSSLEGDFSMGDAFE